MSAVTTKKTDIDGVNVDPVLQTELVQEPIVVRGSIQFMLPSPDASIRMIHSSITNIQNTLTLHTGHLEDISHRVMNDIESIESMEILYDIRKILNKRINNKVLVDPNYVKTKDAASYIAVDPSFLTKGQGTTFKEGIHYFRPEGSTILRWDLEMLEKWLRTAKDEEDNNAILDKMFS